MFQKLLVDKHYRLCDSKSDQDLAEWRSDMYTDPVALEECLCKEVEVANQWYSENGMIVYKSKHQALILGDTEHTFSFPVKESIDFWYDH